MCDGDVRLPALGGFVCKNFCSLQENPEDILSKKCPPLRHLADHASSERIPNAVENYADTPIHSKSQLPDLLPDYTGKAFCKLIASAFKSMKFGRSYKRPRMTYT